MIETIILDVDGVIIGEKIGYNSPYPHIKVITAFWRYSHILELYNKLYFTGFIYHKALKL